MPSIEISLGPADCSPTNRSRLEVQVTTNGSAHRGTIWIQEKLFLWGCPQCGQPTIASTYKAAHGVTHFQCMNCGSPFTKFGPHISGARIGSGPHIEEFLELFILHNIVDAVDRKFALIELREFMLHPIFEDYFLNLHPKRVREKVSSRCGRGRRLQARSLQAHLATFNSHS